MYVIVDNFDAFSYNLAHALGEHGVDPVVYRGDGIDVDELAALRPQAIIIASGADDEGWKDGPGACIEGFARRLPILGVGLGQLCIATALGGRTVPSREPHHGKTSRVIHEGTGLFANLPVPFQATRYDSSVVVEPLPAGLVVTARTSEGEVMALEHLHAPIASVQFDPASIFTESTATFIQNVVHWVAAWWQEQERLGNGAESPERGR